MPGVCAAFCDHIDSRKAVAVLGGCVTGIDADLGNRIQRHVEIAAVVVPRGSGGRAINHEIHVVRLGAVDADSLTARLSSPIQPGVYSGNQLRHFTSPIRASDWSVGDGLRTEVHALICRLRFDQRRRAGHNDLFGGSSHLQHCADLKSFDLENNSVANKVSEAMLRELDSVASRL